MPRRCFDISFFPAEGGDKRNVSTYRVSARGADEQAATEGAILPLGEAIRLENQLHASDGGSTDSAVELEKVATQLGRLLFDSFFKGDVRDLFFQSYGQAKNGLEPLRIRLRFHNGVPELAALSWEYIYWQAGLQFWARTGDISIVRYLERPDEHRSLWGTLPLRLLTASASPSGAPLNIDDHENAIDEALSAMRREGLVERQILSEADSSPLAEKLGHAEIDLLHIVAHGEFDSAAGRGSLILQDLLNRANPLADRSLAAMFSGYLPRLVVLAACEGGKASRAALFDGVAQQLVLHGIPAVIAMRAPIRECDTLVMTTELYSALARGKSIDQALNIARARIRVDNPVAWGIPTLYSRSPETHLFDLPRHFGHIFARQLLAIEDVLETAPQRAVPIVCKIPLESRNLGHGGGELLAIQRRLRSLRSRGKRPDYLWLYRQLHRFLELLIRSSSLT